VQRTNLWIDCIEPLDGLQSIQYPWPISGLSEKFCPILSLLLDVGVPGLGCMSFLQSYSVASCVSSLCLTNLQILTYQGDYFKDGVRSYWFTAHRQFLRQIQLKQPWHCERLCSLDLDSCGSRPFKELAGSNNNRLVFLLLKRSVEQIDASLFIVATCPCFL
jgi:hypothetical protein